MSVLSRIRTGHILLSMKCMMHLTQWKKFIHADTDLPARTSAGMIHYQFEAIHPFLDGMSFPNLF